MALSTFLDSIIAICPDGTSFKKTGPTMTTRNDCLALDAQDTLAPLRQQFALPEGVIYLDGNSLGARPVAALARAQQVIAEEWGNGLIRSWNSAGWRDLSEHLGNRLAGLIGARDGEVVVTIRPQSTCSRCSAPLCVCKPQGRRRGG